MKVFGVVGGCSDGMPANIAVTSFRLSIEVFWGRVIELGRGRCWDLEAVAEGDRLSAAEVYRSGLLKGWAVGKN